MHRTQHSTWDPQWSKTEHEVFRDFGHAAFTAQMLESSLVQILLAAEHAGRISFKKKEDIEAELFLSRKTFGNLITELKRGGMDEKTAELLQDALDARNYLTHNFFAWNAENFISEEGRGKMLKELQDLRFRIGRVQVAFSQARKHIYEQFFGITSDELDKLYREYLKKKSVK